MGQNLSARRRTAKAASEKQIKYLRHLVMQYYCEPYQREDRNAILNRLRDYPHLSKKDACRAIGILKLFADVMSVCNLLLPDEEAAAKYYEAHVDINDDRDIKFLKRLWARI